MLCLGWSVLRLLIFPAKRSDDGRDNQEDEVVVEAIWMGLREGDNEVDDGEEYKYADEVEKEGIGLIFFRHQSSPRPDNPIGRA